MLGRQVEFRPRLFEEASGPVPETTDRLRLSQGSRAIPPNDRPRRSGLRARILRIGYAAVLYGVRDLRPAMPAFRGPARDCAPRAAGGWSPGEAVTGHAPPRFLPS